MTARCKHCGRFISETHSGPCPACGKTGKTITVDVCDSVKVSDSVRYTSIHEYYERNAGVFVIAIIVTVASSFLGLFLVGLAGVFAGLALGAISFFLGPKAATKVREITHGH